MGEISVCGISEASEFESLWALPRLPLTERFGTYRSDHGLAHDQELVISVPAGHVQLRRQLDPTVLYTDAEYSFRTGASAKSIHGVEFFLSFMRPLTSGRRFRSIVDVGGNDRYLAERLLDSTDYCAVIDPICAADDGKVIDGVHVFGRFGEDVNMAEAMPRPDLIVCRHTLEHVARPRAVIEQWFRECADDCLYVIEVPCFENLVESQRFDAVFHQHYHYYDLAAFKHLVWSCGGEYLAHTFNHQGSCGGALLLAFRKARTAQPEPVIDLDARVKHLRERIDAYRSQMTVMGDLLRALPGPVYGYGAGLMLATMAYHLGTDLSELECVLDDDPAKNGTGYVNLPVEICQTAQVNPAPNSSYLITSLENLRPIYRRITELTPRRILMPLLS